MRLNDLFQWLSAAKHQTVHLDVSHFRSGMKLRLFLSILLTLVYIYGLAVCWEVCKREFLQRHHPVALDVLYGVCVLILAFYLNWHLVLKRMIVRGGVGDTNVEKYKQIAKVMDERRGEERAVLAHTIHEELGQHLAALKIQLRRVEEQLEQIESSEINPVLDALVESSCTLDGALDVVKRVSLDLQPAAIGLLGVVDAMKMEVEQFQGRHGLACEFWLSDSMFRLSPSQSLSVFRIFQEALEYFRNYTQSERLVVECMMVGNVMHWLIDGGCPVSKPVHTEATKAYELCVMRDRARELGGNFHMDLIGRRGVRAHFWLPTNQVVEDGARKEIELAQQWVGGGYVSSPVVLG